MKVKSQFVAMLLGENSEVRNRKSDGQMYTFCTIGIMQDGQVANIRTTPDIFKDLQNHEHFKKYRFWAEYDTDYPGYVVVDLQLYEK